MQSFDRALCRALVEPCAELRAELYVEPCAEPRVDVQTCRRADVCRDDCMGNCIDV